MTRRDYDRFKHVLSDREAEACDLSLKGLSQRTIAFALGVSRSAVQSRLENASRKLANARKEAA